MISSESDKPVQGQTQVRPPLWENDTLQGALTGLIPLGLLVLIVIITLALTALIRQLLAASGFFVQQQAAIITLIVGLVISLIVYGLAIYFTLRRVANWQQTNMVVRARAALWALGITAFIVILPVLLTIVLPQHPAP